MFASSDHEPMSLCTTDFSLALGEPTRKVIPVVWVRAQMPGINLVPNSRDVAFLGFTKWEDLGAGRHDWILTHRPFFESVP